MASYWSPKRRKFYLKLFYFTIICLICLVLYNIIEVLLNFAPYIRKKCQQTEPIDVVYTWVNGSDPIFLKELNDFLITKDIKPETKYLNQRFDDKHELKFSLRSLEKYAPWINHVYIVTNGQIPYWLNLDCEKVSLVTHEEIFLDQNDLPTFSSPAIEAHLHRIQGLSKKFLYFNDDVFLGHPVYIDDFISPNNGYLLYLSYPLGKCAPHCFWVYVADSQCDEVCNNFACQYDGGDCDKQKDDELKSNYIINNTSLFFPKNRRKIQNFNDDKEKKIKNEFSHFQLSKKVNKVTNYSFIVEEYNTKLIEAEKLKRKRFKRRQRRMKAMKLLRNDNTTVSSLNRTECSYSASLQHSNRAFNSKYEFLPRAVPSHTPILIVKDIMENLHGKFSKEILVTSKNRIRSSDDLQFSFSYYYFIVHETEKFLIQDIFNEFDTDLSGTWSDREIRTLLTRIYQLPLSYAIVDHFESILLNCSENRVYEDLRTPEFERYLDSRLPTISKELVLACSELVEILSSHFGTRKKYKYKIVRNFDDQYFKQLKSNVTEVVGHLDEIRSDPRKFICLNDNLDYTRQSENELINSVIYDFYLSLFPFPSQFELPKEYRNRFLHLDELKKWKSHHFKIKLFVYFIVLFIFYIIGFNVCIKKICVIINKLFY